ncbi:PNG1 with de-n-glycosylation function (n-glycanase) [Fusarium subglutinans]|uniref:PNG1 with de-n-glycosylation function (N-glycanase) n=1 Tax=Gibberella subglutinans TaxID=42677 RepID=A0A8H5V9X6_GIBSU|nr:PNG1 with de-n-glycosylation function (n-glycanase) [Fusarium subglutinans]KAF5613564.1 PNG1 with de-n-glycosylation function (n-glycanase) [Fusarium subglutinans]
MPFSRILSFQDDKWNNPEDSIGTFIGFLRGGRYRCWEAVGPARLAFSELSPDIKNCLETSNIPPADIVSWSIYMVGHTEENAAPEILICSTDSKTRKKLRKLIRDSKIMDKYPGIGLGDVSALPDRPVIRELP